MRVSKRYVDELLTSTDPVEAVSRLSQFWGARARVDLPRFGLSETEYNCQLCLIFFGEVGNGGLGQYFLNRGVSLLAETSRALRAVGFGAESETLQEAAELLGGNFDPAKMKVPEDRWSQVSALESRIQLRDVDNRLLSYLRAHRCDVLQSEIT